MCNACGERVMTTPSSKTQHEAAEDRARALKAERDGQAKAAEYCARANQAILEGDQKAAEYEAKANARAPECTAAVTTSTCAPVTY